MELKIRKAALNDVALLIKLRLDFLSDESGPLSGEQSESITAELNSYFPEHLAKGDFIAVIAEQDGCTASAAFLSIAARPANPSMPTGKAGTILNVYTYPEFRRKGLAAKILSMLIDEAGKQNVSIIDLNATADGKPVYEKLGFQAIPYTGMRLKLKAGI